MPMNKYENEMQHSLYGRKFGLDASGFLVGNPGERQPSELTTAASTLTNFGVSVLSGSTADFTLPAPRVPGIIKTIVNASTLSTATMGIVRSTADGFACAFLGSTVAGGMGSTSPAVRLNLVACGAAVTLCSISSAIWAPIGFTGNITSSAYTYSFSTSS